MEDMAAYYVEQMRAVQPQGPYRLGGMCAGGVIAYAMAAHLRTLGERVEVVTILDGATPQATQRSGRVAAQRLGRMRTLLDGAGTPGGLLHSVPALALAVLRKAGNTLRYESRVWLLRQSVQWRFRLLQTLLRHARPWPLWLPALSVAQIYDELDARYQPPALADVAVLLVRASQGSGDDTPYRDIYSGDDFGWRQVAAKLMLTDVAGGHASMLQEVHVDSLAATLLAHLPTWSKTPFGSAT
jgi:thioesterase domain-containing protein